MKRKENMFEIDSIELVTSNNKKTDNSFKRGLGRGLSSLLGDSEKSVIKNKIAIENLSRNRFQPRKQFTKESIDELTSSIKEQGVIQPIVVRPDKISKGKYEIIAGERRWLASQNAGLHEVPVVILDVNDEKSLEIAIIENVQREELNSVDESKGYQRLIQEFNYTQDKLSKFIGKSRSYISNSLRLLNLPSDVLDLIENGILSAGHGRSLIGLNNSTDLAKKIVRDKLSVRQAEKLVRQLKDQKIKIINKKDSNILDLQKILEDKTGLNVTISNKKNNSGNISFHYKNLEQLDKIINTIKKSY
tara:strand:+ start:961 stop:1872 length:912 start_codon:yes stop_codon:yes gene_type:complete